MSFKPSFFACAAEKHVSRSQDAVSYRVFRVALPSDGMDSRLRTSASAPLNGTSLS